MTESQAAPATSDETKPRVLVVDDVEDNRDLLTRRLERRGFQASAAGDGPTALEMLDSTSFDVVLLDWMMPGMSGLDVLDAIRGRYAKTDLPVLMATAKTESEAVVQALEHGANDYVSKPIDFPVLVARLEAQLSMRQEVADRRPSPVDVRNGIEPGTVIDDRYEIVEKIGEGGFAAVYRAIQLSTGQTVAFKLLLPHRARRSTGDVELVRFLREMEVIANIEHPGVVRLVDSGQIDIVHDDQRAVPAFRSDAVETVADRQDVKSGTQRSIDGVDPGQIGSVPYIVMEFLDGRPLSSLLNQDAPLSVQAASDLAIPILSALGAAHDKGIVHRDIKPHNILLVKDHRGREAPKVLDFGIAKITERGVDELTQSDAFIGTPEYMSPEQGRGKKDVDGRADLFSVGAVLYQAVTGRRLYDEESFLAMIHAVAAADFQPPSALGCELPQDFEAVLLRALSRRREDRQSSVRDFARELLPYASSSIRRRYEDELFDEGRTSVTVPAEDGWDSSDGESETASSSVRRVDDSATDQIDPDLLADGEDTERMQAVTAIEEDQARDTDPVGPPSTHRSFPGTPSPNATPMIAVLLLVVVAILAFLLMR